MKKISGISAFHAVNLMKLGYILIFVSALYVLRLALLSEGAYELVIVSSKIQDMCLSVFSAALIMTSGALVYIALP